MKSCVHRAHHKLKKKINVAQKPQSTSPRYTMKPLALGPH